MITPSRRFFVPDLCNVPALSVVVLASQLLVVVLLLGGGELSWPRFALLSLFVQWVALTSAALLCVTRGYLSRLGSIAGAFAAFLLVLGVTLLVGVVSDRVLASAGVGIDWPSVLRQMVIAGVITGLVLRYFHVQNKLREQEQSELQSRIQALQSRIRPHFLFNSMNIIASLIATDPDTAESVVEDLSELFRASLNDAGNQVELTEELELCQRYMRIEQLRLGERLGLSWRVPSLPKGVRIPLLTLQPLLENAIYHGIQPLPEGGTIEVRVGVTDTLVSVDISNPVPGAEYSAPSQGNRMAVANIRSRLNVLYGPEAELSARLVGDRYETHLHYPIETFEIAPKSTAARG